MINIAIAMNAKFVLIKADKPPRIEYMSSYSEVVKEVKAHYGKFNIDNLAQLFAEHNMVATDDIVFEIPAIDLKKYREYDRKISGGWTGKMSEEEYEELKTDIELNGIKSPLYLVLDRQHPSSNVHASLGEGNHRLRIILENGSRTEKVPLKISYRK